MSIINIYTIWTIYIIAKFRRFFGAVRTGISRANSGNDSCHRNGANSIIGAMRFRFCLRMGAVISAGNMIHGRVAYQLSSISRKIWTALEERPTEIAYAYRLGRSDKDTPSLFWPHAPIAFTEKKGGGALR